MRVVSLLPSASEILCAIGGEHMLVGKSHECDHPESLESLPILTGQRTTYEPDSQPGQPARIDAEVRAALGAGLSLYTLDIDLLAELKPDLILTQDLCEVCSVDLNAVRAAVEGIKKKTGHAPEILSLDPHTIEAVFDDLLRVGEAVGLQQEAMRASVELRGRLHSAQDFVNPYTEGPIVGFMEWTDPIFVAGHWNVQLIERAGGRHPWNETVAAEDAGAAAGPQMAYRSAGKSKTVTPAEFAAEGPEYLVIAPCGLNLEQTRAASAELQTQDWFRSLPAVKNGNVALVDGNQMFNRPGPRLVDAFEFLVGFLNDRPGVIPVGFPWKAN
jgi:iron complex transport system substrate-binding protein